MKKIFLAIAMAVAVGVGSDAFAQGNTYTYTYSDADGFTGPVYGGLRRVSPNGRWACGGDEFEETGAFVINTADPENVIFTADGYLLDIDDNGMAVGAWYEREGYAKYQRAAIYRDGQWKCLPLPKEIIGRSYAVALSADSRIISGHAMCASEDAEETGVVGGKYFPITWELDDATGEYAVKRLYNNLYLPGTMGFFVYDMTPDAKIICGMQCLNMGDNIAAMLDTESGELKIWHTLDTREIQFDYAGEWYYSDVMTVDGIIDGGDHGQEFYGMFIYATDRYLFGCRDIVSDVDENGNGIITNLSTIYDLQTGEFIDGALNTLYLCGVSPDQTFNNRGEMRYSGGQTTIEQYLRNHCGIADASIDGVYAVSDDAKVLAGSKVIITEIGDMLETPVLVMVDQPVFTGIVSVSADNRASHKISSTQGRITVEGADNVTVYTASGMAVGAGNTVAVPNGIYIVNADGCVYKVAVK